MPPPIIRGWGITRNEYRTPRHFQSSKLGRIYRLLGPPPTAAAAAGDGQAAGRVSGAGQVLSDTAASRINHLRFDQHAAHQIGVIRAWLCICRVRRRFTERIFMHPPGLHLAVSTAPVTAATRLPTYRKQIASQHSWSTV